LHYIANISLAVVFSGFSLHCLSSVLSA